MALDSAFGFDTSLKYTCPLLSVGRGTGLPVPSSHLNIYIRSVYTTVYSMV